MTDLDEDDAYGRIYRRLREFYTAKEARLWMRSEHPQLNGERPRAVIKAGRGKEVEDILDGLETGAYL